MQLQISDIYTVTDKNVKSELNNILDPMEAVELNLNQEIKVLKVGMTFGTFDVLIPTSE